MKIFTSILIAAVILCASFTQASTNPYKEWFAKVESSNGWSSSGGEGKPETAGAAWFTSTDFINLICIERAEDFSISEEEFKDIFKVVVETWRNYYYHKKPFLNPASGYINFFLSPLFGCKNSDFTIYLGTETPEIQRDKKKFNKVYGLTSSSNIPELGRNGPSEGYMWLADPKKAYPKSHRKSFHAMLLHEMGHVFGNDHAEDTIMSLNIVNMIDKAIPELGVSRDDLSYDNYFSEIDGSRMLLFNYKDNWSYTRHQLSNSVIKKITGFENLGAYATFYNSDRGKVNYKLKFLTGYSSLGIATGISKLIITQFLINNTFYTFKP